MKWWEQKAWTAQWDRTAGCVFIVLTLESCCCCYVYHSSTALFHVYVKEEREKKHLNQIQHRFVHLKQISLRGTLKSLRHFCDVITSTSQHPYGSTSMAFTGYAYCQLFVLTKKREMILQSSTLLVYSQKHKSTSDVHIAIQVFCRFFFHFLRFFSNGNIFYSQCDFQLQSFMQMKLSMS